MPISDKHKVIFIHIPKTGGTTIEKMLDIPVGKSSLFLSRYEAKNKPAYQHYTYEQLKDVIPAEKFNSYEKITFVRNPWDKLVSAYFWNKRGFQNFSDFVDFVESTFQRFSLDEIFKYPGYNKWFISHILPQYLYVGPDVTVYKFENFQTELPKLLKKYNIEGNLRHDHKKDHQHYSKYYDDRTKDIVSKVYAKDISLFNYVFELKE